MQHLLTVANEGMLIPLFMWSFRIINCAVLYCHILFHCQFITSTIGKLVGRCGRVREGATPASFNFCIGSMQHFSTVANEGLLIPLFMWSFNIINYAVLHCHILFHCQFITSTIGDYHTGLTKYDCNRTAVIIQTCVSEPR